jgi:tetratricopeptide (TPR) repeat protein
VTDSAQIAPPADARPPAPWLYGPVTDILVGCGGWSLPLLLLALLAFAKAGAFAAFAFSLLTAFCNNPHYMATILRASGGPREAARYRRFTTGATALVALVGGLLYSWPALLPIVFTTYIIWSSWHYTAQNRGIALMLARRGGVQISRADGQLLDLFFICSCAFWAVDFNSLGSSDPRVLSLAAPAAVSRSLEAILLAAVLVSGAGGVFRLAAASGARALAAPLTLMGTQILWFIAPALVRRFAGIAVSPLFYSAGILAVLHSSQSLWMTSFRARSDPGTAGKSWSLRRYYLALVVGGVALFIPGPWLISELFQRDLAESLAVFVVLVNLHHFILEGAIWNSRDSGIARLHPGGAPPPAAEPGEGPAGFGALPNWLPGGPRVLRRTFAAVVLTIGALDQIQFYLTMDQTTLTRLRVAGVANRHDTRVYFQRAKIFASEGDTRDALAALNRGIALNPRNLPSRWLKGELLAREGRFLDAFAEFELMDSLFKPMPPVLVNAAVFALRSGQTKQAVAAYEKAVALIPNDENLRLRLAETLAMAGQNEKAARQYSVYIATANSRSPPDPQLPLAEAKLAELFVELGQIDKAVFWHKAAAAQGVRAGQPLLASQSLQRLAQLFEKTRKFDDARQAAVAAIQAASRAGDPSNLADSWLARAEFLHRQGDELAAYSSALLAEKRSGEAGATNLLAPSQALIKQLAPKLGPKAASARASLDQYERSVLETKAKPTGEQNRSKH